MSSRSGRAIQMKTTALVIRHGPGCSLGMREMVDMALVLATFDCPVSVILQDDGVFWASLPSFAESNPLSLNGRLKSLPLYDVETILIDENSLQARDVSIHPDCPAHPGSRAEIATLLRQVECILEA